MSLYEDIIMRHDIISLEQETITYEPLLINLVCRSLRSFSVSKTVLSHKNQWNEMFDKAGHDCLSSFPVPFIIVIRNGKIVWKVAWIGYYLRLNLSS